MDHSNHDSENKKDFLDIDANSDSMVTLTPEELERIENETRLAAFVRDRYKKAETARIATERVWLDSFYAYRGWHDAEAEAAINKAKQRNANAANLFIKVTKTKTQAAYGQLLEILFGISGQFPLSVRPTPVPEGVPEVVHVDDSDAPGDAMPYGDLYGFPGDGKDLPAGATRYSLLDNLSNSWKALLKDKKLKAGYSPDRTKQPEIRIADEAARQYEKLMLDQLAEQHARRGLRKTAFECALLGTGIYKGPFTVNKVQHKYSQDPATKAVRYEPTIKLVPGFSSVSCWNFYPDPEAACLQEAEYVTEVHLYSPSQIRALANIPLFSTEAIKRVLLEKPARDKKYWETDLKDSEDTGDDNRYEVLEYWGTVDADLARALGLDYDEDEVLNQIQVNVWVCQGHILRFVMNPFTPMRIPYFAVPYEEQPYQIWGIGIPENMVESQKLINGHMRMAIDNLRLAGNVVFEVDERYFRAGEDFDMYAGKVLRKQAGPPGQSLFGITFPNTSESHLSMMRVAQQLADQQTLPSIAHGQTGISGVGRTAGGIQMLMQASQLSIKTVIRNFDDYLLQPLGEALYQWNMQFNSSGLPIYGDVDVVATGTESFVKKEQNTQSLITFMQIAGSNPATAPLLNAEQLVKDIAESMSLDGEKYVNDPVKARFAAELIGAQGGQPPAAGMPGQSGGNVPAPGQAPVPGEQGFTGNPEQQLLDQMNQPMQ